MEDMNIKVFSEKKKKKWATWEEKEKDLRPYLCKIVVSLQSEKPDPSVKKEMYLLKAIIEELKPDNEELSEKMRDLREEYFSPLKEIYKMPGCIDELLELLKYHPTIGTFETDIITQEWYAQYRYGARKRVKNSSTPEKEIKEREELLKSQCVEIEKVRAKMDQLDSQIYKVVELLQKARISLFLASKVPDNKDRSSSSREDSLSSSCPHLRRTLRLHKRARDGKENESVEDNVTSPTHKLKKAET